MKLEYLWGQLANVDQILYEASLGWMKGCIRFWDRLDQNSGFHGNRNRPLTYNGENDVSTFSQLFLIRFFLYLQVTRICISLGWVRISARSDHWLWSLLPLSILEISHRLIMGKWCLQASSFIFYRIFIKLAGNQDRHKISDEFEFRPDRISHFGVTCPCGRIKFSFDILWNLQVQLTFQTVEFFVTLFLGTVSLEDWNLVQAWTGQVYHLYQNQAAALIIPSFLHFSFSPIFNIEIFCHTFLGNCEA